MRGIPTTEGVEITKIEVAEGATSIGTSGHPTWAVTPDGTNAWGNNKFGQVDAKYKAQTLPVAPSEEALLRPS